MFADGFTDAYKQTVMHLMFSSWMNPSNGDDKKKHNKCWSVFISGGHFERKKTVSLILPRESDVSERSRAAAKLLSLFLYAIQWRVPYCCEAKLAPRPCTSLDRNQWSSGTKKALNYSYRWPAYPLLNPDLQKLSVNAVLSPCNSYLICDDNV